jgi:hypothetical protein
MKNETNKKRKGFFIYLNDEERAIVDELLKNNINLTSTFKMFLRKYLKEIGKINENIEIKVYNNLKKSDYQKDEI